MRAFWNNGKGRQVFLKRSLATKNADEANKRAKPVLIEFDNILERADALKAKRPQRTSLSPVEIKRMADYHYAKKLAVHDEYLRIAPEEERELRRLFHSPPDDRPIPEFGLSAGQIADMNANLPHILQEAEKALAHGDIGHITFQIDQVLNGFQIDLDRTSMAYRKSLALRSYAPKLRRFGAYNRDMLVSRSRHRPFLLQQR